MNQHYTFRKVILFYFFSFLTITAFSQVGIGTTNPNTNALLEIDASTTPGGLLLPRVALVATNNVAPLSAHLAGMAVYNTATTTGTNGVSPGYYFNDGSRWVRIAATSDASDDWKLTGNAGTVPGTNFIGTTDNVHFEVFTFNSSRMRFENDGQVSIGFNASPVNAGHQFNVGTNYINGTAIGGFSGGSGRGVYGQNIGNGYGVYGVNSYGGVGVYGESLDGLGFSFYGLDGPVYSDNTFFGADAVVGFTDDTVSNGFWGVNSHSAGTGIIGGSNSLSIYTTGGSGVSGSGSKHGIYAYAGEGRRTNENRGNAAGVFTLDTDSDVFTPNNRAYAQIAGFDNVSPDGTQGNADSYYGGYFSGGNENGTPSYAYAGMKYSTNNQGNNGTNFKIVGNGTNSTLINDTNGVPRIMFSPEAPEILFQDFGVGKLNNGIAYIKIDPILKNALHVDDKHPLKVYITLEGECNGVYVTDKSIDGFTVKELRNGSSNVSFSWQIVANRADDINARGEITSKHIGLRLPVGPSLLKIKEAKMKKEDKRFDNVKKIQNSINNNNQQELASEEEVAKTVKQLTGKDKVKRD
ncbi:hypothetical protein [Aequorivita sinensis]|uniref:hypothetical protein n=1 Tax=Aequorivita sinensis TaxID=1382458 RepID=UPI001124BD67|nr:hypothetical protein [Aequorivita sinensis]